MTTDRFQRLRILEAMLFASSEPLSEKILAERLADDADVKGLLAELQDLYANRGVNLVAIGEGWAFRTAPDLAAQLTIEREVPRKLSRAATETLAIIAYHQPVTRAEIEEIRGVATSKGTVDMLLELGWVRPRGRRRSPGRPVTWGTTDSFLDQFGLPGLDALPGLEELKATGMLDRRQGFPANILGSQAEAMSEGEGAAGGAADEEDPLDEDTAAGWDDGEAEETPDRASG